MSRDLSKIRVVGPQGQPLAQASASVAKQIRISVGAPNEQGQMPIRSEWNGFEGPNNSIVRAQIRRCLYAVLQSIDADEEREQAELVALQQMQQMQALQGAGPLPRN
jgi:hypothetical protein